MVTETRDRSEMKAVAALSEERDTMPSVRSAPPQQANYAPEEVIALERRLEIQLSEIRDLLNERIALITIARERAERSNECLEYARCARQLIRAYVDACTDVVKGTEDASARANLAYDALVAFIEKPL